MIEVIIVLKVLGLSWVINRLPIVSLLFNYLPENIFTLVLKLALECLKCTSLYVGLIITQNIWISILCSFIAMLYERTIGEWEKNIKI